MGQYYWIASASFACPIESLDSVILIDFNHFVELELECDRLHPLGLINWIMFRISQKYPDFKNILFLDEILSVDEKKLQNIADWSELL